MKSSAPLKLAGLLCALALTAGAANNQVLGWNNLGMHCMDSDYSVFSILPPYNTIEAQLIVNGHLVTSSNGYTVTYQAVADPAGSFNSTALGKGNFYTYATPLFNAALAPEAGLAGWSMPGPGNTPQNMGYENTNYPKPTVPTLVHWWRAEGIPLSPYDDAHNKNPYPLMLLVARDAANNIIATNQIVLPISDEMDCRACHASGTPTNAMPAAGWVWDSLPERDFRLNILRLHDERQFALHAGLYASALAAKEFNPAGLYRSVTAAGKPVLCAACHASEALGAGSYSNIPPLTASVHSLHAGVTAPGTTNTLDNVNFRSACYLCHPGSATKCLRGAMGGAIAADGSMSMQCQNCHGNMSAVGAAGRTGWLMEPRCQGCHVGTANHTATIRYTSVFTNPPANTVERTAVDQTFATVSNTPAGGLSLYRFSAGHGGLQCSACHGSTHAEFPSTHLNDNLRNIQLQGHAGVMVECTACHTATPTNYAGGPHGMHPMGTNWVTAHPDFVDHNGGSGQCQACHGTDYRGTVLSRMQADRTLSAFGTKTFFRGAIIGCYTCHTGPGSETGNSSTPPTVTNVLTSITNDKSVAMTLPATGSGLTLRLISQAANGSVGLNTNTGVATYFPDPGFVGTDKFTFAAYDGSKNSNLGTGTVVVTQGPSALGVAAHVPPNWPAAWPAAFAAVPAVTNHAAAATFDWNFGDGSAHDTNQYAAHAFAAPGSYPWTVTAKISGTTNTATAVGVLVIDSPVQLALARADRTLTLAWPHTLADTLVEASSTLDSTAHWRWVTNAIAGGNPNLLTLPLSTTGNQYFRVRQPQ